MHIFTMKLVVAILSICALASCVDQDYFDNLDWSTVKSRDIIIDPYNGARTIGSRIVGGTAAQPHQFPYQGGLIIVTLPQTYFCGCTLISPNFVLTAAHCLDGAIQIQVRLGAHYINAQEATQQRFVTTTFSQHPAWNQDTLSHDLGVVQLGAPAILNEFVQIISLPTYADTELTFAGETAILAGWGVTSDNSNVMSETLQYVISSIITNFVCNVGFLGQILPSHICTAGDGGIGACTGDSGSGVISGNRVVGVKSFALALSCQVGWPSGHARVTSGLDWIAAVTGVTIQP